MVNGHAQLADPLPALVPSLPVGTDAITAVYMPATGSSFSGSTSQPFYEVIHSTSLPIIVATTTTVTPKQQTIVAGSEASFTIAVTPANVPGTDTVPVYDISPASNAAGSVTSKTLLGTANFQNTNSSSAVWMFTTTTPLSRRAAHDRRHLQWRPQVRA